ncbi:MAG: hypothetical protein HY934_06880 [Candidatus Firestonebacteria bacterium]|nr:hypothetical protein [Candidatus Firestonebacteria bacterium]
MSKYSYFFLIIFLSTFPLKILSFDLFSKGTESDSQLTKYIAIQGELDNINLQVRSGKTARIYSLYIPSYGVTFQLDYDKKVFFPYKEAEAGGNEEQKQSYIEMTSLYNSILKRIAKINNLEQDDNISVQILTQNIFIQRIIKFKYLKKLYSNSSEFNILQSILKFESTPEKIKNRILLDIEKNYSFTYFDIENNTAKSLYKMSSDIEKKIFDREEIKVAVFCLPEYGVLMHITDQSISTIEQAKEIVENIIRKAYKLVKQCNNGNKLFVAVRKDHNMFGGNIDLDQCNPDDLDMKITWWEYNQ